MGIAIEGRVQVSALYIGSKLTFGLAESYLFSRYSSWKFFNQASDNLDHQLLEIADKATNEEMVKFVNVNTNRLNNFSIQKGNCFKEFTKITFQLVDAAAQNHMIPLVTNIAFLGVLYVVSGKIMQSFESAKILTIEYSHLSHEVEVLPFDEVIKRGKLLRKQITEADINLKNWYMIVMCIDFLNTILYRDREVFRIQAIVNSNYEAGKNYDQEKEARTLGRTYDDATKSLSFVTGNYFRCTEVVVVALVIEEILDKILIIQARQARPELKNELAEQEKVSSKDIPTAQQLQQIKNLSPMQIAELLKTFSPKQMELLQQMTEQHEQVIELLQQVTEQLPSSHQDTVAHLESCLIGADGNCLQEAA